jgi:hypothetical protein
LVLSVCIEMTLDGIEAHTHLIEDQ